MHKRHFLPSTAALHQWLPGIVGISMLLLALAVLHHALQGLQFTDVQGYLLDIGNGTEIGFLRRTPNNGRRDTQLRIPKSLLNSTGNTLRFEQNNPGWIWGVTDLLLRASDTGL